MQIDFEFSGGYANIRAKYHANTDELPKELVQELLKLVESSGFFNLQQNEVAPSSAGPPDVFFYRLSLRQGSKRNSLSFNDITVPTTMHPLLGLLRKLALEQTQRARIK